MITSPSGVQLTFDNVNAETLAINYVICKPLILQELLAMQQFDDNPLKNMEIYTRLQPIATKTINALINFLPHFEFVLHDVVQLLHPKDPNNNLVQNYPSPNVVIFQGSPCQASNLQL